MTLDRFKVFAAAARYRSVTRASAELDITQPAVTKQLKSLERDFNINLYRRHGRGIELTEAGQVFLRKVKIILKDYDSLIQTSTANPSATKVKTLTIGGTYGPATFLLPSLLARFKESHPETAFSVRTDNKEVIEGSVLNGDLDVALLLCTHAMPNPHLAIKLYSIEPLVAFVHPQHPLAKKPRITLEELGRFGFVVRKRVGGSGAISKYVQDLRKQGSYFNVAMRCDTPGAVKEAVRNKMGVGLLFCGQVETHIKRGEFKAIKLPVDTIEATTFIVHHKTRPLSPVAQDFLALLWRDRSIKSQTRRKKAR